MLDCHAFSESSRDSNSCKQCTCDTGNSEAHLYWDIQLDQDLLQTLVNIYPEWFSEYNLNIMTDESGQSYISVLDSSHSLDSPPNIDEASIQKSMEKNKESLKVKLMLRRPISQLVEQGIIPSLKTSPGFYEQSKKLERARMGDFLKHKIQRRPDRQSLIEQHILEDTTVSPSLHDKQRQLKKARLADDLNDRLSHRPGPLELVKGNILLTDERFAQAVKEGQIQFKATCEGEAIKHPPPRFVLDESSSDDAGSPPQEHLQTDKDIVASDSFVNVLSQESPTSASFLLSSPASVISSPSSVSQQTYSIRSLTPATFVSTSTSASSISSVSPSSCGPLTPACSSKPIVANSSLTPDNGLIVASKDTSSANIVPKSRKKSKSKAQPKTKTIKFHEYKGPPNAQKKQLSTSDSSETSYELLLKQQQLFLQWQLEWQQKYPQIILPAAQKTNSDQGQGSSSHNFSTTQIQNLSQTPLILTQNRSSVYSNCDIGSNSNAPFNMATVLPSTQNGLQLPSKSVSKLEDMKVSDLKLELKKRNLPVSGAKPQLIERLKPFFDDTLGSQQKSINVILSNGVVVNNSVSVPKTDDVLTESSPDKSDCKIELNTHSDSQSSKESAQNSPLPMEVDANVLINTGDVAAESSDNNSEDIFLMQQKRIEELQKELQRSQLQLHIHNSPVFTNQPHSVTIPLSAITTPQIQFVSATPQVEDAKSVDTKLLQRQILQQHLQQKMQQQQQQANTLPTLISAGNTSAAVKANLAAFIHHQASQQQQQLPQTQQGTVTSVPTFVTTQLIDPKTFPTFQHVLLYPGSITATNQPNCQTNRTPVFIKQERTNSLPNVIQHKSVSQRATSLPNFASLVDKSEVNEKRENVGEIKPPPDYNEATKQSSLSVKNKCRNKKKPFKSQAVDDVLEILIKNGELPPSAAQEPSTPTTPEKSTKPKPATVSNYCSVNSSESSRAPLTLKTEEVDSKTSDDQNDFNIDFDFSMELQELADSMDFSSLATEQNDNKVMTSDQLKAMEKNFSNCANNIPGGELSLSEFIDFQESSMNVDDSDWLQDIVMPAHTTSNSEEDFKTKNFVLANNNFNLKCQFSNVKRESGLQTSSENVNHDPLLPNSIVENSQSDPLIDLFFDESDYKPCNDVGVLVWEKSDFTA